MKLEEQEIAQLKNIRSITDEIVIKLGEISFQKINLDFEEKQVIDKLAQLTAEKNHLTEELFKKYGKVNINIETGECTPL